MSITIATSIAPRNIELQQGAVESWKQIGFDVISVNSGQEIKSIKDSFPNVKFVEASRNALVITKRPFIYFDDILKALEMTESQVCGIVNSDIYLFSAEHIYEFINKEAKGAFLFGSRINIPSLNCFAGEEYFDGFDYFFFDRAVTKIFIETDFCLGSPWWDYWAPLVPLIKGYEMKKLITPIAYHVEHATKWSPKHFRYYERKLLHYLLREDLRRLVENDLREIIDYAKKDLNVYTLAIPLVDYIHQKVAYLPYYDVSDLKGYTDIDQKEILTLKYKLNYCKYRNKSLFTQIIDLHRGISWKIITTVRWIYERLQR